jgi:hypothetical protein
MYILLRRTLVANPTGATSPYRATVAYFDTVLRKPYYTYLDSQVNDPAELKTDEEVFRYEYRPGFTRGVYYNGNGSVYTKNLGGASAPSLSVKVDSTAPFTEAEGTADASIDVTGKLGQPPYEVTVVGAIGSPSASYRQTAISPSENYPVRFSNLPQGEYTALVRDARGSLAPLFFMVAVGVGLPRGPVIFQGTNVYTSGHWRFNNLDIKFYAKLDSSLPPYYVLPYGEYVDGFLLAGSAGKTWRQVYSDGRGSVYFRDTSTAVKSLLELDNIIEFHPDTPTGLGGFIVEMNATALPLTFALGSQSNQTGRFDGLAAGTHEVKITDALGATMTVPVLLICRYAIWRTLDFTDVDGTPVRVELWLQDYTDEPAALIGGADPVTLKSDGLSSALGGQGDLPPVVGTSCELRFRVPADTFEEVLIGREFLCRADVYYGGSLEFRGYVQPALSNQPLLPGAQAISLTATDGLAQLADTAMTGHVGQRLYGHRPILHNLLHCLSRTGVTLPLHIVVNRRDATMADDDAPELAATTNRTGYWDEGKNEPETQRNVIDGLAQVLGGTLCQREGTWQIRSALEAAASAPGRVYRPAGTADVAMVVAPPTFTITPPTAAGPHWLKAEQLKQVRAGWKSLIGQTDVGWLKNAFPAGAVFSDKYAWLPDFSKLRPVAGWHPAPDKTFPLIFTRAGGKGSDYSTIWPRSLSASSTDGQYLESPLLPLAAGTEAVPAVLTFSAKLVPTDYYQDAQGASFVSPLTPEKAVLPYEVIIDGQSTGQRLAEFKQVANAAAKDVTFEVTLPPLPSTAGGAVLRVYSWLALETELLTTSKEFVPSGLGIFQKDDVVRYDFGTGVYRLFIALQDNAPGFSLLLAPAVYATYFHEIPTTNANSGQLLLSSVAVQLRPQGATWEGEDNFRADGTAGTVRPTEVLKVYHPDPPLSAGLFGGNLFAFARGVGLVDGTQPTSWARKIDLKPAPLFESVVLDGLALRAGASRLLTGPLRLRANPVRLLDTLDTPSDVPGRRFLAGALEWSLKQRLADVSLVEIGPGADAPDPLLELPEGVRIIHEVYEYKPGFFTPVVRMTHDGRVRIRHL